MDFRRKKPPPSAVCNHGTDVEIVQLNNQHKGYKKGLNRVYLMWLRSSMYATGCSWCFISLVVGAIFFAVVCQGTGIKAEDTSRGRQQTESGKQRLLLALSWPTWRSWWSRGCWPNCWPAWKTPPTPSIKLWTFWGAALATEWSNPAATRNDTGWRSSTVQSDFSTPPLLDTKHFTRLNH